MESVPLSQSYTDDHNESRPVNALSRIRSLKPNLANSELRVANWILRNPERIMDLSMAQVAHECSVSDTTVLRFCRSTGFLGYTDLKLSIARDLGSLTESILGEITADDDVITITQKVFSANIQALRDTLAVINHQSLSQAVEMLSQARKILIVGVGTSAPIAKIAENYFFRLGLNCKVQTDSYLQLMEAALVGPEDVVLGISQSGSSLDPVLTMKLAKRNGAHTVCITGNAQSPFTEHADVILLSVSNEARAETIASRLAQISIIDTLYLILSIQDVKSASQNDQLIWDAILPKMV